MCGEDCSILLTGRAVEVRAGRRGGLHGPPQVRGLAGQVAVRGDAVRGPAAPVLAQHQPRGPAAVPVLRADHTVCYTTLTQHDTGETPFRHST